MEPDVRTWQEGDSLEDLTRLINRAYESLAAMGLAYLGTHQRLDTTANRMCGGQTLVAVLDGRLVGTVTVYPPGQKDGCPYYRDARPAVFGQFAVCPDNQGKGLGKRLLRQVEALAQDWGAESLACDTSESAFHLIDMYSKWGFSIVGEADWRPTVNYKSVILARPVPAGPT